MLSVRGLTIRKPSLEVINLSFQVNRGDILTLIGPNNSGKSAILERIADPDSSFEGSISLNHFSSKENEERYKAQIGYLPQNFTPPMHLTGFEFLEIVGSLYYLDKKERVNRIISLAKELNCDHQIYRTLEQMSVAHRQRVGLVATLLAEPSLLIWDEPFENLDHETTVAATNLLQKRIADGGAAVLATNNLDLAEELATQITILDEGQVVAEGTLAQLAHHAQTKKSLGDIYLQLIKS